MKGHFIREWELIRINTVHVVQMEDLEIHHKIVFLFEYTIYIPVCAERKSSLFIILVVWLVYIMW